MVDAIAMKRKVSRTRMVISLDILRDILDLPKDVIIEGVSVENRLGESIMCLIVEGESVPENTPEVDAIFETTVHEQRKFKRFQMR